MKDFIPHKEALELRELGFDEPCFGLFVRDKTRFVKEMPNQNECETYFGGILAPTFSQAFRWFREKYGLIHNIQMSGIQSISYDIRKLTEHHYKTIEFSFCSLDGANTYEKAELACLIKLIEIVKTK